MVKTQQCSNYTIVTPVSNFCLWGYLTATPLLLPYHLSLTRWFSLHNAGPTGPTGDSLLGSPAECIPGCVEVRNPSRVHLAITTRCQVCWGLGHMSSEEGFAKSFPSISEIWRHTCFWHTWSFPKNCCNFKGLHSSLWVEPMFWSFIMPSTHRGPSYWDDVKIYLKVPWFWIALSLHICYLCLEWLSSTLWLG